MDQNEFTSALSLYLDEAKTDQPNEAANSTRQALKAPLNNFFQDDMLTLLSRNTDILPRSLAKTKHFLEVVADSGRPRHVRASAAVELGRYVRAHRGSARSFVGGASKPKHWFHFAADLNSVVGAWELANENLAEKMLSVELNTSIELLPSLKSKSPNETSDALYPDQDTVKSWWLGTRITLRHLQGQFKGWEPETFYAAVSCLVNWLVLLPQTRPFSAQRIHNADRTASLTWIKPLWTRLIAATPEATADTNEYHQYLSDQRKAVLLLLSDGGKVASRLGSIPCAQSGIHPGADSIVVIPGVIAPPSDKSETECLKLYEALRRPVLLTPLPDTTELKAIRTDLETEFPWATDAITVILNDLVARRRHGAVRLGMQPVLLAGTPGTGKTRFAQRLSELLGTPNTVINLAGMSDAKTLKGVTRGWASNRPSRMLEFIQQTKVANPLFILDEVDKAQVYDYGNGGRPHDALLDLLEPGNARRYTDVFLMTECNLSHCLYILTANSLLAIPEPLLSRVRIVFFPAPGPEHADVIAHGILRDMEHAWAIPPGVLTVSPREMLRLVGLAPREMKRALLDLFGREADVAHYTRH